MQSKQAHERAPAASRRHGEANARKQGAASLPPLWSGLWMTPWVDFWTSMWTSWLGQGGFGLPNMRPHHGEAARRQEDSLPWLPRVETTVIPLRRRTDPPGEQAEKISLRVQMPWLGGGNVIAIDTVVPRGRSNGSAETPSRAVGGEEA